MDLRAAGDTHQADTILEDLIRNFAGSLLIDDAVYLRAYIALMDHYDYQRASQLLQSIQHFSQRLSSLSKLVTVNLRYPECRNCATDTQVYLSLVLAGQKTSIYPGYGSSAAASVLNTCKSERKSQLALSA